MRIVETYSSNIWYMNIIIFIMLYIISLVFIYLITGCLYFLIAFTLSPHTTPLVTTNLIFFLSLLVLKYN